MLDSLVVSLSDCNATFQFIDLARLECEVFLVTALRALVGRPLSLDGLVLSLVITDLEERGSFLSSRLSDFFHCVVMQIVACRVEQSFEAGIRLELFVGLGCHSIF